MTYFFFLAQNDIFHEYFFIQTYEPFYIRINFKKYVGINGDKSPQTLT